MKIGKEGEKNNNYFFKPNKDFSFRNDDINDENEDPNKTLVSNLSSKKLVQIKKETKKIQKKMKAKKIDLYNQLLVNKLEQENKFLKEEIEIARSNILILEEKESQYKSTIEHINTINKEKDISYKNVVSLINNYKTREKQFNYKLSLYSQELKKKNKIINQLNIKINELNVQISNLKNILSEKNKLINLFSRNKRISPNPYDISLNCDSNLTISKSLNIKNHNKKESDIKLHYREKTLDNLNNKYYDFNSFTSNVIDRKISHNRINTINNMKFYEKLNINNNSNNKNQYLFDNNNYNFISNTETSNKVTQLVRKNSAYKKILNYKNNLLRNIPNLQLMRKNNSFKNIGYNSINSTINKNKNTMNNSINLISFKKPINKNLFKKLNLNSDKREIKQIMLLSPSNKYLDLKYNKTNQTNKNNRQIIDYNNLSYISNNERNYLSKINNKMEFNKKGKKFNKKYFFEKKVNTINDNPIPINKYKNENKNNRKIEINKFFISNVRTNSNSSFGNILTERNKMF